MVERAGEGRQLAVVVALVAEGRGSPRRRARCRGCRSRRRGTRKSVAAAFQLSRVSAFRISDIVAQLPRDLMPDPRERFAWPRGTSPQDWKGFRRVPDEMSRQIEHVGLREISNTMVALCASCGGMEETELLKEALAVFGGRRMTTSIAARMGEALLLALDEARLDRRGGLVVAA
jgi:hypothetical protein